MRSDGGWCRVGSRVILAGARLPGYSCKCTAGTRASIGFAPGSACRVIFDPPKYPAGALYPCGFEPGRFPQCSTEHAGLAPGTASEQVDTSHTLAIVPTGVRLIYTQESHHAKNTSHRFNACAAREASPATSASPCRLLHVARPSGSNRAYTRQCRHPNSPSARLGTLRPRGQRQNRPGVVTP